MAKKKASDQQDNLGFENVEQTLTKTEQFLEKNAKQVGIAIGAVVLVVLAVFAYTTYIVAPNSAEAGKEMSKAIKWFETDSMALALNGNSDHAGFLDIMDEYSGTPAGNSAHYYAGLAYFSQGSFQDAIEILDGYSASDVATAAMAKGVIGDAFAELGQMDDAADYYKKAANATDNNFTTPLFLWKAGLALEAQGDANKAVSLYQRIADDYPKSRQAAGIESVIAALK
ncbi:MAG: tetratricopeptide repeat protein [Schleiferiaceae bacterium]|jgi:tetratricopeptide (TPR) repeat protein|nr:tetratricopeptide repeat protein [Schleiferiaceae bacterium]